MLIPFGWAAKEEEWPVHGSELIKVVQYVNNETKCPVVGTNLVGQITHGAPDRICLWWTKYCL